MTSSEIRKKFLDFFEKRGHKIVLSSSLIPDDSSVLLTTAGMQQFKPYYVGKADPMKDFGSLNTASVQKCIRTSDIGEVGDERHLTFFEMLGNFSFGGYFKKEAIEYAHDFITKELDLKIVYVSVFGTDSPTKKAPVIQPDEESKEIWKSLGVKDNDIHYFGREDNFWGPTGTEGPCGPTTEIYVENETGKPIEIWNIVFNEYYCHPDGRLEKMKTLGVDTGMGLERLAMVVQRASTIFETDLFLPLFGKLKDSIPDVVAKRIVIDHLRAATFLLAEGILPSNKETGYILRRLLRRALFKGYAYNLVDFGWVTGIVREIVKHYSSFYPELRRKEEFVVQEAKREADRFYATLETGLKMFDKQTTQGFSGEKAFQLFSSHGFPLELILEIAKDRGIIVDVEGYKKEFKKHQETSRAGQEKKFGGHGLLLDTGELKAANEEELKKVTRLHTATHMLQQALREVLGPEVHQAGSDITVERTRFDFTFGRKLTPEEIKKAEDIVNKKIEEDLTMQKVVLPKVEAEKTGALYFFKEKYPDPVNVYFIGESLDTAWSKEFCGGPHVSHTGEIGRFRILKEEGVASGVRRIRATVEP